MAISVRLPPIGHVEVATAEGAPDLDVAFRAIFDAELDYVWTNLRRFGVPERDVEDVAHEVFLRILHRMGELDPTRPVRPWLFGFTYRVASDYRRLARHRRERHVDDADSEPVDSTPPADEQLHARDAKRLVARALLALDLDKRAVFIAHDLEEQPAREIAEHLGIPLFTVYSRLRVARERFVQAVQQLSANRGPQ